MLRRIHGLLTDPVQATSRRYEVEVLVACLADGSAGILVPFLFWEACDQLDCEASVAEW